MLNWNSFHLLTNVNFNSTSVGSQGERRYENLADSVALAQKRLKGQTEHRNEGTPITQASDKPEYTEKEINFRLESLKRYEFTICLNETFNELISIRERFRIENEWILTFCHNGTFQFCVH